MSFDDRDSTLNVQQYIQQTIQQNPADIDLILTPPPDVDDGVWKYEHLRQFCLQLNGLAFMLQCSAIDYTRHTLDGAASLLNSNKYFPSRINIKESSLSKLGSVCRRVYRIFSRAYFHHRPVI
ncbi:MOB member 4, phocein [Parelaphostrongylus tenuis]|uniref:MOB member 4, phocein n=1 Tax=Parelaphostrongylus tenuis TaxID=148309 RepID=A0AAD5WK61_PARTN|nr:MOB member 4, phocein [Parelaphostrongylus tenuis]